MADKPSIYSEDTVIVQVAREIALDLNDIQTILKNNQITSKQFDKLKKDPRFLKVLESEITAWNAAGNTHERTKLKAGMLIEEWLPEANKLIHGTDPLPAKAEIVKVLTRIAGMGLDRATIEGGGGERFSVTINLGAQKLEFQKTVTPKVIEHEPKEPA